MKKLLWAAALALPLVAASAPQAKAFGCGNWNVDMGAKAWFNVRYGNKGFGCGLGQAGPWYLYWPYEAHFQTAAPGVNPFFPPPMTLPPGFGQPPMQPAPQGYPPMLPADQAARQGQPPPQRAAVPTAPGYGYVGYGNPYANPYAYGNRGPYPNPYANPNAYAPRNPYANPNAYVPGNPNAPR